jgi:serine/threonine protein kinase
MRKLLLWCFHYTSHVLLAGVPANLVSGLQTLYSKIKNGVFYFKSHSWKDISPTAMDLVKKLLDTSQLNRLTVQQALAHPWFGMDEGASFRSVLACFVV